MYEGDSARSRKGATLSDKSARQEFSLTQPDLVAAESGPFSPDYATARLRFRQAASRLGWQLEAHPIRVSGPAGEELTLDVAYAPK